MSGLIHRPEQITDDIIALECRECHRRYVGEEMWDLEISEGELQCSPPLDEPACAQGGLKPIKRTGTQKSKVSDRWPSALADVGWTATPDAIWHHREALELSPHELILVLALEQYRPGMGQKAFPSRETLIQRTGLSLKQLKTALGTLTRDLTLEKDGRYRPLLIKREQPGAADSRGRGSNRYLLDPLWLLIAELEQVHPTPLRRRKGSKRQEHLRSPQGPQFDEIEF